MLELLPYLLAAAGGAAAMAIAFGVLGRAARSPQREPGQQSSGGLPLPKQTMAELQRFRAVVDGCVDSIYMVDRETLKFVDATATASSRTGYSHEIGRASCRERV